MGRRKENGAFILKIIGSINARGLNRTLERGRRQAKRLDTALNSIANMLESSVEQNFVEEGRPKLWKMLSDSRIKQRSKRGEWPGQILTVSSQLRGSINTRVERNTVFMGSNKPYAKAMDRGSKKRNIPARHFLLIQKGDVKETSQILLEHILK